MFRLSLVNFPKIIITSFALLTGSGGSGCSKQDPIDITPDPRMVSQPPVTGDGCSVPGAPGCWSVSFGPTTDAILETVDGEVVRAPTINKTVDWELAEPANENLIRVTFERVCRVTEFGHVNLFWKGIPMAQLPYGNGVRGAVTMQFDGDDWFPVSWSGNVKVFAIE